MMKCDGKMHISTNELLCSSCTATVVVHTYSHIIINFLHDNVERCEMHMYMMTMCIEPVRITFDPRVLPIRSYIYVTLVPGTKIYISISFISSHEKNFIYG